MKASTRTVSPAILRRSSSGRARKAGVRINSWKTSGRVALMAAALVGAGATTARPGGCSTVLASIAAHPWPAAGCAAGDAAVAGAGATVPPGAAAAGAAPLGLGTTLGSAGAALPWMVATICGVAMRSSGR